MSSTARIGEALGRFETALSTLETSMVRYTEKDQAYGQLAGEAQALRKDRARLLKELSEVRGKANELAKASREASGRIESAMARIRGVLDG